MARENAVVTHSFNAETGRLEFVVRDAGKFEFDVWAFVGGEKNYRRLPINAAFALVHGVVQKVSDRAAIGRDPDTGASATPTEKFEAMKDASERIATNEKDSWNAVREGGENGGLLYRAMKALHPNVFTSRKGFVEYLERVAGERGKSVDQIRKDLAAVKSVAAKMDEFRVKGDAEMGEEILKTIV